MEQIKKITQLKQGDIIKGIRNEALQVISYKNGELFYYNEMTREFKTVKISKNESVYLYK